MSYQAEGHFTAPVGHLSPSLWQRVFRKLIPTRVYKLLVSFLEKMTADSGRFRRPFSERQVLLYSIDLLLLSVVIWGGFTVSQVGSGLPASSLISWRTEWYWSLLLLGSWWLLATLNDLYDLPSANNRRVISGRILLVGLQALLIYGIVAYGFPGMLPNPYFFGLVALAIPFIWLWRILYTLLSPYLTVPQRVLMIGSGEQIKSLAYLLQGSFPLTYQVVGHIDDPGTLAGQPKSERLAENQLVDLQQMVDRLRVNEVVVAVQGKLTEEFVHTLMACQSQGVQITWMPNFYERLARYVPVQYVDPAWALYAVQGQRVFQRLQLAIKRMFDLLVTLLTLPTILLLFPLVALAIRLNSVGPIFYRQVRSGRGGKPFMIYKFRTMYTDAEKDGKARWATENDPRITGVGRFLRKTRIDELPQILNILKGDMSIVGPRPERPEFVKELEKVVPFYQVRLMVKPGLTGWAQIHYDYGNSTEDALLKLQYDFYYIRYWSLWLDLYTMFKTVSVVLKLKGL